MKFGKKCSKLIKNQKTSKNPKNQKNPKKLKLIFFYSMIVSSHNKQQHTNQILISTYIQHVRTNCSDHAR